jgi:hypothetical protein
MSSPNLVIARAGEQSRHKTWGTSPHWDLLVSYYGTDSEKYRGDGFERVDGVGGKLEDTFNLWHTRPDLFKDRKYVWLVDDDMEFTTANIDKLFLTMGEYNLQLAQPALSLDGFISHPITAVHEGFKLRYTTMVETMVPCWSMEALRKVIPLFEGNRYGWGLDHIWSRFTSKKGTAILDCVQAKHCRCQGTGELYDYDLDPITEMTRYLVKFRLVQVPNATTLSGVLEDGRFVEGSTLNKLLEEPLKKILASRIETAKCNPIVIRNQPMDLRGIQHLLSIQKSKS